MRVPSKFTSYQDSTLPKFPIVLDAIVKKQPVTPNSLYETVRTKVEDISEFLDILDCLFALKRIELTKEELLVYVG